MKWLEWLNSNNILVQRGRVLDPWSHVEILEWKSVNGYLNFTEFCLSVNTSLETSNQAHRCMAGPTGQQDELHYLLTPLELSHNAQTLNCKRDSSQSFIYLGTDIKDKGPQTVGVIQCPWTIAIVFNACLYCFIYANMVGRVCSIERWVTVLKHLICERYSSQKHWKGVYAWPSKPKDHKQ